MTSLIVTFEVNPAKLDDFIRFLTEAAHAALTREPGCLRLQVTRVTARPSVFILTEFYANLAALETHRVTSHFLLFKNRIAEGNPVLSKTSAPGEVISA